MAMKIGLPAPTQFHDPKTDPRHIRYAGSNMQDDLILARGQLPPLTLGLDGRRGCWPLHIPHMSNRSSRGVPSERSTYEGFDTENVSIKIKSGSDLLDHN